MGCGANFKDGQLHSLESAAGHGHNLMIPVCSGDLGHESVSDPGARTERYEIRLPLAGSEQRLTISQPDPAYLSMSSMQ
jgi:hypothetical protein